MLDDVLLTRSLFIFHFGNISFDSNNIPHKVNKFLGVVLLTILTMLH